MINFGASTMTGPGGVSVIILTINDHTNANFMIPPNYGKEFARDYGDQAVPLSAMLIDY